MYLDNAKTVSPQPLPNPNPNQSLDSQALCLAILEEQRKSRRWSNLFKMVGLTIISVFLMGIYSNQYSISQAKLTSSGVCSNELKVNNDEKGQQLRRDTINPSLLSRL